MAKEQLHPWSVIPCLRQVLLKQLLTASKAAMLEGMWGSRVLQEGFPWLHCFKDAVRPGWQETMHTETVLNKCKPSQKPKVRVRKSLSSLVGRWQPVVWGWLLGQYLALWLGSWKKTKPKFFIMSYYIVLFLWSDCRVAKVHPDVFRQKEKRNI